MKFFLVIGICFCFYLLLQSAFDRQYRRGFAEGQGSALKTNPPSEELEMVCAGMWVGEQNKKYFGRGSK